ncbi:MAG: hypothetical protein NTW07_08915 [candidate division Zixibacteria bacterium]|nr:hypothetical protein [candidate division Zixibacteria bacterium]
MNFRSYIGTPTLIALIVLAVILPVEFTRAQGSIFGEIHRTDLSVPPDDSIQFLGFIRDADNEIRIQSCIGAGYESGHWYDDFQNFLNEAVGVPYHYYFFDQVASQMYLLNKTIPNNSFQQEDIALAPLLFPAQPQQVATFRQSNGRVRLQWDTASGVTWHVYRRPGSSLGSFFRIDNPSGNRLDHGVTQPYYVDSDVDSGACYSYVVVAESGSGTYSPASEIAQIDLSLCCVGLVGNVNASSGDEPTIGDILLLVDHLYISYTDPVCMAEADVNQSGGLKPTRKDLTLVDISILINHLFIDFRPLHRCSDAGQ